MNKLLRITLAVALTALIACGESNGDTQDGALDDLLPDPAPTAAVLFQTPNDGDEVTSPVTVVMEAHGITIEPATAGINENAGHFHIMVNVGCVAEGEVIPTDDSHRHYGMAQTEAELELEPGEHTLCLQVGDGEHVALPFTDTITVTVTE